VPHISGFTLEPEWLGNARCAANDSGSQPCSSRARRRLPARRLFAVDEVERERVRGPNADCFSRRWGSRGPIVRRSCAR